MKILKIILFFILLIFSGCEKGTVKNKETAEKNETLFKDSGSVVSKIKQNFFKGNYTKTNYKRIFRDCSSKTNYLVVPEGEISELEKFYEQKPDSSENFYVEIEGFTSERSNTGGSGMDTVLVVTKFLRSENNIKCD